MEQGYYISGFGHSLAENEYSRMLNVKAVLSIYRLRTPASAKTRFSRERVKLILPVVYIQYS
jgi:hypothetical protein